MHNLLEHNCIVSCSSPWQEAALERTNKIGKDRPDPLDQHLGEDFINSIAKADWAEFLETLWTIHLGDQSNEGVSQSRVNFA